MKNKSLSNLIETIYSSVADVHNRWGDLVALIAEFCDVPSCGIALVDIKQGRASRLGFTANFTQKMEDAYEEHFYKSDLWAQRVSLDDFGNIFVSSDVISREELERTEFYNDWVRKVEITDVMGTVLPINRNIRGVFGIHRAEGDDRFDTNQKTCIRPLIPHLTQAISLSLKLNKLQLESKVSFDGATMAGVGIIIVDAAARVLFCNTLGEMALDQRNGLTVRSGKLNADNAKRNALLHQLIADAAHAAIGRSSNAGGYLALPGHTGTPTMLKICPLRPEHYTLESLHPKAVIFIAPPTRQPHIDPVILGKYYGLTSAEAQLAVAIVNGERLQEYATRSSVSPHTVKTQLKAVFIKTGVTRQSDLVRNILMNPLRSAS